MISACVSKVQLPPALAVGLQTKNRATVLARLDNELWGEWLLLSSYQPKDNLDVASALTQCILDPQRCSLSDLADQLGGQLFHPDSKDNDFGDELLLEHAA